jgi:outer membrane protein OmpA-like peptidoglycan-associated protein
MPWSPERMATTARVAERCTSISNVIGKNYEVSGKLSLLVGGFGGGWSQTGVVLSPEAAERQIQMDRLCRAWAVGAISDDKWTDIYVQFALASIAPLARSENPEAQARLLDATAQLRDLAEKIAQMRAGSTFSPNNATSKLNAAVAQAAANSSPSLGEIHTSAAAAASGVNLPVDTDSALKRPDEKGGPIVPPIVAVPDIPDWQSIPTLLALKQAEVMTAIGSVQTRLGAMERRWGGSGAVSVSQLYRNWTVKGATKVYFALGKSGLSDKSKKELDSVVTGPFPRELRVEVMGYADATGNVHKNALLSVARAEEVRDYLIFERHVPASYVVTLGRKQGVSFFGAPAENRVVTVKVFEDDGKAEGPTLVGQRAAIPVPAR